MFISLDSELQIYQNPVSSSLWYPQTTVQGLRYCGIVELEKFLQTSTINFIQECT